MSREPGLGAPARLLAFFFIAVLGLGLNARAQTIESAFSLGPLSPYAVFSHQDVTVNGEVSSTGGASTKQGHVRSNGNITVNSNGKIDGDARPGPGKSATGNITGITIPSLESLSPAPIDLAALETQVAAQNDNSKIDSKLIPNRNLTLNSGQSLPLQPGTYYLNNVNINSNATLTVSGLVKILVTGSFNLNATANAGGLAPNLRVWVKSTSSVNINSNAQMRGYVYAPNATVNVNSNATLTGGIFAKQVTVNSNGAVKRWLGTIGLGGPSVAITEPREGDVAANLSAVLVKGTVSDPDGVGTVSVTVNGSPVTPAANGNFEKTVDLSGSSQRRITVTAVDADGQTDTKTVALCGPPPVTLTSPAHGSTVTTQTVTLTGTCGNATTLTVNGSPVTCGGGTYTTSVNLGPGYGAKVITVVAQGSCEAATERFVLFYAANPDYFAMGPWMTGQAVFSHQAFVLDNNGEIRAANASGVAQSKQGHVVSNATVTVKNNGVLDGDAWAGLGQQAPSTQNNGKIEGTRGNLTAAMNQRPIDPAAVNALYQAQNDNINLAASVLTGTEFKLTNNQTYPMPAGTYYFTKFTLENNAKLTLSGAVRIVVNGPVSLGNNAEVNRNGNPYNLRIWMTSAQAAALANNNVFVRGFLYVPDAKVTIDNGVDLRGGIFAKEVEVKNNAKVYRAIDSSPPVVSITQPSQGTTPPDLSAVAVSGTVTDADGNLATVHVNGTPVTVQPNGTYTATVNLTGMTPAVITVVAVDLAGQIKVETRTLQTCTQPPVITVTSPVPNGFVKTEAITVTGGCGTASTVTVNGVSAPCQSATYSASITLPAGDGTKTITVVGTATGCPSATQNYTVTLDTIPPVISIDSPPPGATITSSPVTVTGPVTDVNLQAVSVNGAIATFPSAGRFSATLPVTEGPVTLVAAATDKAGNATASPGIPVTVMLSGPSVTITPPAATLVKTQQITLTGTATGTPPLTVTVSNQPAKVTPTNTWTATVTLVEGPNSLTALVRDAANRTATSNTVNEELDTQAPRVTIDTPASGCRSTGTVTLGGVYADTHPATTAAVSVEIRPGGGTVLTQTAAVDLSTRRWTLANVSLGTTNGTATVTVTAKDSLEQTSKSQAGWRIDTTPPVITLLSSGTPFPVSGSGLTPPQGTSPRLVNSVLSFTAQISDGEEAPPSPVLTLDGQPYSTGTPVTTEGQHLLTARATDCAQNEGTAWALFTIDRTGANLVTTTPAEGAVLTQAPASYSGTADTALSAVKLNGVSVTPSGAGFTQSPYAWKEGLNTVQIELTDTAGNETAYERHFTVRTLKPSLEIVESGVSITPGAVYYRAIKPEFRTNDPQSTVSPLLDGQPYSQGTPIATAGTHTLSATVRDSANQTANASVTFTIDLSGGPSIAITSPADGAEVPGPTVSVTGTASGTGITVMVNGTPATLTGTTWTVPNLPLTPDTVNDIVAVVKDSRSRTASAARSVMVRSSGPRIVITEPLAGFATNRKKVDIAGAVVGGKAIIPAGTLNLIPQQGTSRTVTLDATGAFRAQDVPLAPGVNTVTVTGTDAHNRTGSTTAVLTSDQTTPGVSITAGGQPVTEGQTFGGAVTLQITVTDDGTSVPVPEILLNGAAQAATGATTLVSISQPGGYVVSVAARDAAGNETRVERGFLIDPGSCALTALEPSPGSTTGEAAVTLHGKSGSARAVKVRTASGAEYTALVADGTFAIADLPVAATGTNAFTLVCLDRSGGEHSQSYTLNRLAAGSGPQITLTSPQNGGKQTQSTVTVTGTVSDPAASVRVNGTFVAVNQSTGSFSAVLTISEGPNVIVVEALDVAKRRTVERRLVEKDSQAPEIQITSPLNNQHLGRTEVVVTGRITIEDEPNLQTVVVETVVGTVPVGTVPAVTDPDTGRFRATAPLSGTAGVNTSQTVRVRATDTLGQTSVSEVSVYADPQGPALSLTSPDDLTFVNTALPVSVSGTASGREGARISVNGTLIDPSVLTWSAPDANGRGTSPFTASVPLPSPVSPPYEGGAGGGPTPFTVVARVEDLDGAFANERRLILIDTVAPSVVEIYPANGARQVDPNTIPLVLFSEPTKASTLAAGLVLVKTGTSEPVAGTHVVSGNAVAFVPAVALAAGQQYRLRALAAITDIASNALATASEVTFTVTADPFAAAPQLDPMPAVTCAQTLHVKGSAASGARIRVKDGTLSATGTADQSGRFDVELPVSGNGYHEIRVTALTSEGDAGPEARVLIRIDCGAPSVTVSSFDRNTGTITVTFTEAMSPETLTVGGPADSIRVSDAEDGSRTAQAGTVTLDTARTTALIQLSTSPGAWWRTKPVRLEVRPPARDAGGNAMAAAYETVFYLGGGPGDLSGSFLAGEVYDEGSGRPLSGVTASLYVSGSSLPGSVRISSQTPPVATQTTDGRGRYAMAGDVVSGRYAVVVEKGGYTRAIRRMALEPGTGFVPFDARLTPLSPAVSLAVATGGTLNGPNGSLITLEVSPHAIPSSAQTVGIQLTPVSGQGLPELLPLGWSPVAASEIRVIEGSEALPEGTATSFTPSGVRVRMPLPEGILPAQQLIAVRYDVVTGTWITLTTPTRTTGSDGIEKVEVTLVGPGTVAVVLADEAAATRPPIPAQAGETLAGVSLPETLPALIGTMTLDPPVVTPSGKALAHVEAHSADNQTPWPSGLAVQAYLDEKLILSDGSELYESPFSADLVLYRVLTRRPVTGVRVEEAPGALTRRSAPPSPASAGEGIQQGGPLPSPRVSGERVPEGGVRGLLGPGTNTSPLSGRPGDESPGYGAAPLRGYRSTSGPALAVSPISGVLEFIVSPSPKAAEVLLESGYDNIRLYPYPRQLERGSVLGPAGGTVTSTDGIELTLPEGSLSQRTLVTARALTAQELQAIAVPLGFQLLAGIRIEAAGQSFARGATVTMRTPAGTPADPQGEPRIVLARWEGQPSDGRGVFARVVNRGERIAASGSNPEKVRFAPEAASSTLALLGIISEGTYLILRAESAIGYATGFVRAESGLGYLDARATATGLGTADLSLPGGRYAVPVPAGTNKTVSAKHPVLDETGTAVIASLVANAVAQVDITIRPQGPTIQSVQPVNNASGQPIGTPITMQFSEALDPSSVNASEFRAEVANADGTSTGVQVLGTLTLGSGNTQLVFTPARPLPTGVKILSKFLGGVRDAGGTLYAGAVPYTWSFTTSTSYPWGGQINPAKIRILVPQNGTAQIIGDPGALPATQGTPWSVSPDVDGVVCSPVQVAQANSQGGFGPVLAGCPANPLTLSSIVWLKVFDPTGTLAATIKLGPFTTPDGKGFVARAGEETTYTTTEGIQVTVPAEAFGEAKLVTVKMLDPSILNLTPPAGMEVTRYVDVDFEGRAAKTLLLKIPTQTTAPAGRLWFAGELIGTPWGERLNLIDVGTVVETAGQKYLSNHDSDLPAVQQTRQRPAPLTNENPIRRTLDEIKLARKAVILASKGVDYAVATGGISLDLVKPQELLYNAVADLFVYLNPGFDWDGEWVLPVAPGTVFTIVRRSLATGWIVAQRDFSALSAGGRIVRIEGQSDFPGQLHGPRAYVDLSPFSFSRYSVENVLGTSPSCAGLRPELKVCSSPGKVALEAAGTPLAAESRVLLFNPKTKASLERTANAGGGFERLELAADPGQEVWVVVTPGDLDPDRFEEFRVDFDRPLPKLSPSGVPFSAPEVARLSDCGLIGQSGCANTAIPAEFVLTENLAGLRIRPLQSLPRGHQFKLKLETSTFGDAEDLPAVFSFATRRAQGQAAVGVTPGLGDTTTARDIMKFGNLLLAGSATGNIVAMDISNPEAPREAGRLSTPANDVRAFATDGHGRLFYSAEYGGTWGVKTIDVAEVRRSLKCVSEPCASRPFPATLGSVRIAHSLSGIVTAPEYLLLQGSLPSGSPAVMDVIVDDDITEELELAEFYLANASTDAGSLESRLTEEGRYVFPVKLDFTVNGRRVASSRAFDEQGKPLDDLCPAEGPYYRYLRATVDNLATGESWSFDVDNPWPLTQQSGVLAKAEGITARRGDKLRIRYNRRTFGYVGITGSGITVVDLNRSYRTPYAPQPDQAAGPWQLRAQCGRRLGSYEGQDRIPTMFATAGVAAQPPVGHKGANQIHVYSVLKGHGLVHTVSSWSEPGSLTFAGERALNSPGTFLRDVVLAPGVPVLVGSRTEELDLLFTSLGAGGIEVLDVTNRALMKIGRFFRAKHHVYRLQVDVARGRLYAGGCEDGDCGKPFIDVWSIGKPHGESGESDPRLLYSVPMGWETNHLGLDPSGTGLIFTWSNNVAAVPGPSGVVVPVEDPRFAFFGTYRADAGVKVEPTLRFLPLGAAAHNYAPDDQDPAKKAAAEKLYTPAVKLRIALPGSLGERLGVRLQSLRSAPEPRLWNRPDSDLKKHIALPGGPGWPETSTFVTLKRLSSEKFVEGYNLYESEEHVLLLADPRAKAGYVRRDLPNELADEAGQCRRCDKPGYLGSAPVKEMLVSGPYLRAHLAVDPSQTPAVQQATQAALDLFNRMGENYRAPSGMAEAAMWADSVGSLVQAALAEPVLGRAVAGFEAGASVSLLDGESLLEQTDHSVKARAVGFSFSRGYRSGVLGFGPLGSLGWSGSLFAHLRPNPVTGAVEYFTGTGDVLTFLPMKGYPYSCPAQAVAEARTEPEVDQNGSYCVPKGFYGRLWKMSGDAGWQLITRQHDILYFDASGRLKAIADRHRQDKPIGEQGSTLQLAHDVHGDLIQARDDMGRTYRFRYEEDPASPRYGLLKEIEDHWGRTVRYAFDESRRLLSVTLPKVTKTTLTGSYPNPAINYRNLAGPNGRSLLAGYTLPGNSVERVTFQYGTDGRVTSVSVPASTGTGPGPSWTLQYDGAALTAKATVTQPWGHRVESVLDANGRTTERRELGVPTLDVFGATPPPGDSLTFQDLVTKYTYLSDGRLETELRPDTGRTMYSYETSLHDRLGRLNVSEETHGAETPVVDSRRRGPVEYSKTASQAKHQGDNIPYQFTDALGRKGTAAVPQAASPAVPGSGRNIQEKLEPEGDQPAIVTTQDFDAYGRPVYQKDGPSMSGAPEKWFTYGKDELGKEGAGFLTEVRTQRGALTLTERFERDEHGNVTSRAASYGVSATAEYDEWDRVIRGVAGKGTGTYPGVDATTELGYDETGHLIRERRKQTGVTGGWVETTYQYNSREQLISQTTTPVAGAALSGDAAASATTALEYDAFGRLWKVRSPAGIETVYTYDSAGRIATETRGVSGPRRRGYDPLHRMVFLTDGDQGVWRGYHDIWGRRYREDLPAGGVREREHDAAHGLIRETLWSGDPGSPGVERLSEIRTRERITGDIDQTRELLTNLPETWRVTKKKLDSAGRVIRVSSGPTDAIQRVEKEMAYDSGNRVTREQDAVGNETAYVYPNESPWPSEIRRRETNPAEPPVLTVTSTLTHDALGRVTREVRSDGRTVETTLDEAGNVRVLDEGNGKRTVTSYDGTGKVTRTEKAGTESKTYGYDLDGRILGRRVATAGGTHAETRYQYDGSGRLMVVTRPPNSICSPCRESYTYNPDDTLDRQTLRSGIQVGHAYDSANRLMNRRIVQAGSTGVQPVSDLGDDYTYDRASRVLSSMRPQTDAPPVRYPVYDTGGRPLQEVVGTRTPVGKGYDTWSRETSVTLPHGETYSRAFDDLDRLTEIGTSAAGQAGATWVWGGASRIYGITSKGPLHAAHRYGYIGGLGAQVPSGMGTPATKWKLGTLTVGAQTGTEPVTGPPAAAWGTFGYGYMGESGNKLGREVMESAGPSVLANQGWAWGTDTKFRLTAAASGRGSLQGLSESTAGIERFSYAYGVSDELLSAGRGAERADYQTGAEGNLKQLNGAAVLYDADGRRIEDDRFTLIWNWRGELDHVIARDAWPGKDPSDARVPVGHKVVYARDAAGRLYSRTHLGKPSTTGDENSRPFIDRQEFVWDGQTLMAIEGRAFDGGLTYRMSLVPGATGLDDAVQLRIQRFDASGNPQPEKLYTYLKDELGTNLGLVEERTGADPTKPPLVVRYHYTPYGEVRAETGPEVLRAFFDSSLASVTRFDGTTAAQTVNPAQAVAGGFLLEFTLAPDATTLGAGLIVERRLTDGTWGALQASELAIGRRSNGEAGELIILPLSGWTKDSAYRIRLTQTLKDGFGRSIANAPNLEIPIPADGAAPVFEKRWPFDYESIFAASETANGAFPWAQPLLFHGAFQDPVTGLINLRNRWYDPRTAQFLSEDPFDDIDSPNVYGYVAGRPHEARDPWGLCGGLDNVPCADYVFSIANQFLNPNERWGNIKRSAAFAGSELKGAALAVPRLIKNLPQTVKTGVLGLRLMAGAQQDPVGAARFALAGARAVANNPEAVERVYQAAGNAAMNADPAKIGEFTGEQLFWAATAGAGATTEGAAALSRLKNAASISEGTETLVHLTSPKAAAAINESSRIGGRWGVFALDADKVPTSALGRVIKTLVPGDLSASVEITGQAVAAFKRPPRFGLFSTSRYLAGVRSSPLGSVDLTTGRFVAGEVFENGVFRPATAADKARYVIHQGILDYGIDSLIYSGAVLHAASGQEDGK